MNTRLAWLLLTTLSRGDEGRDAHSQRRPAGQYHERRGRTVHGEPAVRAMVARGEPQHVAWAFEREDGGRGFGLTGGHYHRNWGNDQLRKTVLNAILRVAKVEVPDLALPD